MVKRLLNNLSEGTVSPEAVAEVVEPLMAEHIADTTPHPVYDDLPSGRFVTYLQNGMA